MTFLYIAIGSNIDPEKHIAAAIVRLREQAAMVSVSAFYRTKPLARPEQADFRNGVVRLRPRERLEREDVTRDLLKPIEAALGRVRTADKHAARTIDLDLAVYCEDGRAIWVDAQVARRNFIAAPLAELVPELRLPCGATVAELARALGRDGLVLDETLTRQVQELAHS